MSHTSVIRGIEFKSINALTKAVDELKEKGANITLVKDAMPRMYSSSQSKEVGVCEYVIKLNSGPYDVGFKAVKDDGKVTKYDAYFDKWGGHIRKEIGADASVKTKDDNEANNATIGKLSQLYGKYAAIEAAKLKGFSTKSCKVDEAGNLQLVLVRS